MSTSQKIVVSKFELQMCYYVHFQTYSFGKSMKPLILPSYMFFFKDGIGIR